MVWLKRYRIAWQATEPRLFLFIRIPATLIRLLLRDGRLNQGVVVRQLPTVPSENSRILRGFDELVHAVGSSLANQDPVFGQHTRPSLNRSAVPGEEDALARLNRIVHGQFERTVLSAPPVEIESRDGAGHEAVARIVHGVPRPAQFQPERVREEDADLLAEK